MSTLEQPALRSRRTARESLYESEVYWRDLYHWLLQEGYRLRPRYSPDWVPSWVQDESVAFVFAEDFHIAASSSSVFIDAIRVKDNAHVFLKRLKRAGNVAPEEVDILEYLSKEPVCSDEENHCVPLLACLEPPTQPCHMNLVLPVLRPYHDPDFDTIGEGLEFMRQIFEGFSFLHRHRVVHRDIRSENIMMDARGIYAERWLPMNIDYKSDCSGPIYPRYTRTERPPRYYITDYGFSRRYHEDEMPVSCIPKPATDMTVPEILHHPNEPCDPFPIDVYTLGNLIRMDFMDGNPDHYEQHGRVGFEFLRPLVDAMTAENSKDRVTMAEAVTLLDEIIQGLSISALRAQAVRTPGETIGTPNLRQRAYRTLVHWVRRFSYIARGIPHMPTTTRTRKKASAHAQPPASPNNNSPGPQNYPPSIEGGPLDIQTSVPPKDALPEARAVSTSKRDGLLVPQASGSVNGGRLDTQSTSTWVVFFAFLAAILALCR